MEVDSGSLNDEYSVRWAHHHKSLFSIVERFYADDTFTDCSLAAEGLEICAHKLILSACSPFLNAVLRKHREKHPVIVLKDVTHQDLQAVVEYMYKGQVQVPLHRLNSFLKTAETLNVAGLVTDEEETIQTRPTYNETKAVFNKPKPAFNETRRSYESNNDDGESSNRLVSTVDTKLSEDEEFDEEIEYLSEESGEAEIKEEDAYRWFHVEEGTTVEKIESSKNLDLGPDEDQTQDLHQTLPEDVPPRPTRKVTRRRKTTAEDADEMPPELSRARLARTDDFYSITCTKCMGIYKTESTFLNHLRHDCNQVHTCETCSKVFKNKRHLLDHVRDDCGRLHFCPKCDRPFKQKVNLTTHQKLYCKTRKASIWDTSEDGQETQTTLAKKPRFLAAKQ